MLPHHVIDEVKRLLDELLGPAPQGWLNQLETDPESKLRFDLSKHLCEKAAAHPLLMTKRLPGYRCIYPDLRDYAGRWLAGKHESANQRIVPGFVYFIQAENGLTKIGHARDVSQRMRQLQIGSPGPLALLYVVGSDNPRATENVFHRRFVHRLVSGEWYALAPEDLAAIRSESAGSSHGNPPTAPSRQSPAREHRRSKRKGLQSPGTRGKDPHPL